MKMARDRQSIRVAAETAISLALDAVRSTHPGSIPATAEIMVKRTLAISAAE